MTQVELSTFTQSVHVFLLVLLYSKVDVLFQSEKESSAGLATDSAAVSKSDAQMETVLHRLEPLLWSPNESIRKAVCRTVTLANGSVSFDLVSS